MLNFQFVIGERCLAEYKKRATQGKDFFNKSMGTHENLERFLKAGYAKEMVGIYGSKSYLECYLIAMYWFQ